MKLCKKCDTLKVESDFYPSNPYLPCKSCQVAKNRQNQEANREMWRKYSKAWYKRMKINDPLKYKNYLASKNKDSKLRAA